MIVDHLRGEMWRDLTWLLFIPQLVYVTSVNGILPVLGTSCVTVPGIPWREQLRRYEWVTLPKLRTTIYTYRRRIGIAPLQELRRLQILFYEFDYCWTMSVIASVSSPRIEELVLHLVHGGSHKAKQVLESFAKKGSDEVLSRKSFSDSLRCLKIVASGNDETGKSTWLLQAARTLVPRFAQRGTI